MMFVLPTLAYSVNLLDCKIIEAPIGLVDSNAERSAMTLMVFFGKLGDWYALFVLLDGIP
jgi:hypothetical protein